MTCIEIEAALFYHYRGCGSRFLGHGDIGDETPAAREATAKLLNRGLITRGNGGDLLATDGLTVYVEALCSLRLPVQTWVIPTE